MADYLNIAGRVRTTASDGVAMEAQEVKDLSLNKSQQEINADVQNDLGDRYTKEETYNREELNELITTPDVNYVSVVATNLTTAVTDVLPATGAADTIYRVGSWDGTQYDAASYSEYAWNGTVYVLLDVKNVGIEDVPTPGSQRLVTSGGIYNALTKKLDIISIELSDSVPGMIELNYMADSADMSSSHIDEETGIIEMIYNVR